MVLNLNVLLVSLDLPFELLNLHFQIVGLTFLFYDHPFGILGNRQNVTHVKFDNTFIALTRIAFLVLFMLLELKPIQVFDMLHFVFWTTIPRLLALFPALQVLNTALYHIFIFLLLLGLVKTFLFLLFFRWLFLLDRRDSTLLLFIYKGFVQIWTRYFRRLVILRMRNYFWGLELGRIQICFQNWGVHQRIDALVLNIQVLLHKLLFWVSFLMMCHFVLR